MRQKISLGFTLFMVILSITSIIAQDYDQQRMQLQFLNHYGKAYARGVSTGDRIGSEYFDEEYSPIYLKLQDSLFTDTLIEFGQARLNLLNGDLELLYQGAEKLVTGQHIEYILLGDGEAQRIFIPGRRLEHQEKPLTGFVEVMGTGTTKILIQHQIYIREPNPQAHITGGPTKDRLMKTTRNFIYKGGRLTEVRNKKDIQQLYRRQNKILENYIKDHKSDMRDPRQLLALVDYLDDRA